MTGDRARAFVPIQSPPLPRPLRRFGPAFPPAIAEHYAALHVPHGGAIVDPLAYPYSAADAVERSGRRGFGPGAGPLAEWARRTVREAPSERDALAALERVGDSVSPGGVPHRAAMRELYTSHCGSCHAPVVIEAFRWERDVRSRSRRAFHCRVCARDGRSRFIGPVIAEDEERARAVDPTGRAFKDLVGRFGDDRRLGQGVAALYTPRNLEALMVTVRAVESVTAGPVGALLTLALVEVIVSGSAHPAPLPIQAGRVRRRHAAGLSEVNVWLEYERTVRELAAWLDADASSRALRPDGALDAAVGDVADLVLFAAPTDDLLGGWADVASAVCLGGAARRAPDRLVPASPGSSCPSNEDGSAVAARPTPAGRTAGGVHRNEGRAGVGYPLLPAVRAALAEGRARARDSAPAAVYVAPADIRALAACALAGVDAGYALEGIHYQPDALRASARQGDTSAAIVAFRRAAPEDGAAFLDPPVIDETIRSGVAKAIAARGGAIGADRAGVAALQALGDAGLLSSLATGDPDSSDLVIQHLERALREPRGSGIRRTDEGGRATYSVAHSDPGVTPLADRVEWAIHGLLSAARGENDLGLLRSAYAMFPGVLTPERELVERCLASYGVQDADGRWDLRPLDVRDRRRAERTAVLAGLVDAGRRLRFDVAVRRGFRGGPPARGSGDERSACFEVRPTDPAALGRAIEAPAEIAEALDCVWYGRGGMVFIWQVDWTARLHRSLVTLGEAIRDDSRTFRFLAIADERSELVAYKLSRSAQLRDVVARRAWRFVGWEGLRRLAGSPCPAWPTSSRSWARRPPWNRRGIRLCSTGNA